MVRCATVQYDGQRVRRVRTVDRGPKTEDWSCEMTYGEHDEWLEADGLGGFASGTATGVRTRRYHALLLNAHH